MRGRAYACALANWISVILLSSKLCCIGHVCWEHCHFDEQMSSENVGCLYAMAAPKLILRDGGANAGCGGAGAGGPIEWRWSALGFRAGIMAILLVLCMTAYGVMPHGGPVGGNTRQPFFDAITDWARERAAALSTPTGRMLTCHLPVLALAFISMGMNLPTARCLHCFSPVGVAAKSSSSSPAPPLLPLRHPCHPQMLVVVGNAIRWLLNFISFLSLEIVFLISAQPSSVSQQQGLCTSQAGTGTTPRASTCGRHHCAVNDGERASQMCQQPCGLNVRLPWSMQTTDVHDFMTWLYLQYADGTLGPYLLTTSLQRLVLVASVLSVAVAIIMGQWSFDGRSCDFANGVHNPSRSKGIGVSRTDVCQVFTSLLPATLLILGPTSPLVLLLGLGLFCCLNRLLQTSDNTCDVVNGASLGLDGESVKLSAKKSGMASLSSTSGSQAQAWAPCNGQCVLIGATWTLLPQLLLFASGHYCEFSGLRVTAGPSSSHAFSVTFECVITN